MCDRLEQLFLPSISNSITILHFTVYFTVVDVVVLYCPLSFSFPFSSLRLGRNLVASVSQRLFLPLSHTGVLYNNCDDVDATRRYSNADSDGDDDYDGDNDYMAITRKTHKIINLRNCVLNRLDGVLVVRLYYGRCLY